MFDIPPPPTVPPETPVEIVRSLEEVTPLTRACFERVVERYGVHPLILTLVARVEGGWSGAKIKNTNATYDVGKFQINTLHLPTLAKYGITEPMLRNNDCVNAGVAAWYIRTATQGQTVSNPEDYFRAIARYHSKTERHNRRYAKKLMEAYDALIEEFGGLEP